MCPSENLRHRSGSSQKRAHWHWTSLLQRISFPSDFYDSSKRHKWKTNNRQTFLCNTSSPWKNKNPIRHKSEKQNSAVIFQPQIPPPSKFHFSWGKCPATPLLFSQAHVLLYKVTGCRAEASLIFCDIRMKSAQFRRIWDHSCLSRNPGKLMVSPLLWESLSSTKVLYSK